MSRYVVAIEGCPMGDSRVIDHRALSPREESIPVVLEGDWGPTVGWATEFERDEDGNISFEFAWTGTGFEMDCKSMNKHIRVGQSVWDEADGVDLLVSGVIYSIYLNDQRSPWDSIKRNSI